MQRVATANNEDDFAVRALDPAVNDRVCRALDQSRHRRAPGLRVIGMRAGVIVVDLGVERGALRVLRDELFRQRALLDGERLHARDTPRRARQTKRFEPACGWRRLPFQPIRTALPPSRVAADRIGWSLSRYSVAGTAPREPLGLLQPAERPTPAAQQLSDFRRAHFRPAAGPPPR